MAAIGLGCGQMSKTTAGVLLVMLWLSHRADGSCAGNCRLGTFDYAVQRFYQTRTSSADSLTDSAVLPYTAGTADHTKFDGESAVRQVGAHIVGDAGIVHAGHVWFATFDYNGALQKYSTSPRLFVSELKLGSHGGHYFSSIADLGSDKLLLGTAGVPSSIITVQISPTLQYSSIVTLSTSMGGVVAMQTDGNSVIVIPGRAPASIVMLQASATGTLTMNAGTHTLVLDDADFISSPVSPHFLDRTSKRAYVATVGGCVHRVSYSSTTGLAKDGWQKKCSTTAATFFGLAVDSTEGLGALVAVSPYRQIISFKLDDGTFGTQTLPMSKDMSYVTNVFIINRNVLVVGQSRRGIPAILQIRLLHSTSAQGTTLTNDWGVIAGGVCDEYSWTEDRRILFTAKGTEIKFHPTRHYGCIWIPRGRIATGAAVSSNNMLYVAVERARCTVCAMQESVYGDQDGFCVEEYEEYRAPNSQCGQEKHNERRVVWERDLTLGQLQQLTNQLYGAVNMSMITFKIGTIPLLRGMYAAKNPSGAVGKTFPYTVAIVAALIARTPWPIMAILLVALPRGEAVTKSFHQTEDGCNCLRNCEIFEQQNMGDCTDDGKKNKDNFESAWGKLGKNNGDLCKAMMCMAFCSVRQATITVGTAETIQCDSVAKQIGCNMDCGKAGHRATLWVPWLLSLVGAAVALHM